MKGIPLHPLRLKALSEGRLSVLRVPVTKQTSRVTSCPREHLGWKMVWIDPGLVNGPYLKVSAKDGETIHRVYPRMEAGDYFVKEAFNVYDVIYDDYAGGFEAGYPLKEIPREAPGFGYCVYYRQDGNEGPWRSATQMPEWASRYIVTLGDPVPGKLGEVTENDAVLEGFGVLNTRPDYIYSPWDSNPLDEFGETWNQIYPRHPWSPDRWTWAYPVKWRKR